MRIAPARGGLRFAGYASIFDRCDHGGDIVRPGAFRRTLARPGFVPLLWQHQPGRAIGVIEHLAEDTRGLQVIARLNDDEFGRQVGRELVGGRLSGLSFGYRVGSSQQIPGAREIRECELIEVSVVRRPMQPLARVHKVESSAKSPSQD